MSSGDSSGGSTIPQPSSGSTSGSSSTVPTSGCVSAVSLKLPPFWPADPEVWFAQVEAQFTTRRVTAQRTKFDHVIASLSPEVATEIRDLILKPPEADPYSVLKEQLIKRTAASEQRRLQQLFNAEELGDRKPTQLLRRMQQLLGDRAGTTEGAFLRELFLQRLPANVRMVLASTAATTSLEDMAELADKIVEVATPVVAAVDSPLPQLTSQLEQLRTEVSRLQSSVKALTRQARARSSSRTRSRPASPAPQHNNTEPGLCWYHQRFGDDAQKCKPPCSRSNQLNGQASP